ELLAVDRVQRLARDRAPALEIGVRDPAGSARGPLAEPPRGRTELDELQIAPAADEAAEMREMRDAAAAAEPADDRIDGEQHDEPAGLNRDHAPEVDAVMRPVLRKAHEDAEHRARRADDRRERRQQRRERGDDGAREVEPEKAAGAEHHLEP